MATVEKPVSPVAVEPAPSLCDEEGFPWLENGERMTQEEFHERYLRMPPEFKAELIEGVVYVMPSPLKLKHARNDFNLTGCLFLYSSSTPGTVGQNNATTILSDRSEPRPDSALLIREEYGGQSRDGEDDYTHGAPELIVEVAFSSRSLDLHAKRRDYERAGAREYVVFDLKPRVLLWFSLQEGRFVPLPPDPDGIIRSRVFPGLWIDPVALSAKDAAALAATLQRGLASPEHAGFVAELERRRLEKAS